MTSSHRRGVRTERTTPAYSHRRALYALGVVAALAGLIAFYCSRRPVPAVEQPRPPTPPARAVEVARWPMHVPPHVAKLEGAREPDRTRAGLWMLEDPDLPVVVAEALIAGRFPRWSHPLEPGMVDLLEPNGRSETCGALQRADATYGDPALCILFTADKARVLGDQPVYATLEVLRGKERVPLQIVHSVAKIVDYLSRKPIGPEAALTFTDHGDHVFATTFTTKDTVFADHFGYINLEVEVAVAGDRYVAVLDLWNQPPSKVPARFAPPFREALDGGSLTITVGVDVEIAGSYVIDANLFDVDGEPVAYMHLVQDLPEGRSDVPLLVFGRVIREQDARGPYSLANLRGYLFLLGKDPDRQLMPDYEGEFTTRPYQPTDFSDAEFWDQFKEDSVRDLLDAAATSGHGATKLSVESATASGWTPEW